MKRTAIGWLVPSTSLGPRQGGNAAAQRELESGVGRKSLAFLNEDILKRHWLPSLWLPDYGNRGPKEFAFPQESHTRGNSRVGFESWWQPEEESCL